jgi:hypothetical protein
MAVRDLPRGTVTFLFTDVEGSTRLLRDVGAERYTELLDRDLDGAIAEAEAALAPLDALAEDWVDKWDVVGVLAAALAAAGELETGIRLYAAVERYRERRGEESPPPLLRLTRERTHGVLERGLAAPEFAEAAVEGRRLTLQEAVALALTTAHKATTGPPSHP